MRDLGHRPILKHLVNREATRVGRDFMSLCSCLTSVAVKLAARRRFPAAISADGVLLPGMQQSRITGKGPCPIAMHRLVGFECPVAPGRGA